VQLQLQPVAARRTKDAAGLVERVEAGLTKNVGERREALRRDAREQLEEGRDDTQRERVLEAADHAERLELVVEREAVPALDLDGGGAVSGESPQPRQREREQLVLGAAAEVPHGGMDSPALLRDLHVAEAGGAQFLLLVTRLSENAVRVRVHEAWCQDSAIAIDARRAGI